MINNGSLHEICQPQQMIVDWFGLSTGPYEVIHWVAALLFGNPGPLKTDKFHQTNLDLTSWGHHNL